MTDDAVAPDPLPRLRRVCLALPEVTERPSHGEPTWFVGKAFVMYSDHHHGGPLAFWCAAAPGVQEEQVGCHGRQGRLDDGPGDRQVVPLHRVPRTASCRSGPTT